MKPVEPLRGRRFFQTIKADGRAFEGDFLRFFCLRNRIQSAVIRVAVVVGKRHGKAPDRNRIKRRIRASFRLAAGLHVSGLKNAQATFLVIAVYKGSRNQPQTRVTFDDIRNDVDRFILSIET